MSYDNFLNLLGLGLRAGKYELGTMACEKGIRRGRVKLLLLDEASAERTIKNFRSLCKDNGVVLLMMHADDFRNRTGMTYRVVGVKDANFAQALIDKRAIRYVKGDKNE